VCTPSVTGFAEQALARADVEGKAVLEVGSRDVNGSVRPYVESLSPKSYVGVDIEAGPRVDEVVDSARLIERFGPESFDVVITTEMLEHVRDWRAVMANLKGVLRPGGLLLMTTRSIGFRYHAYPHDYWRYEAADMRTILSDLDMVILRCDPAEPGIFVLARKPIGERPRPQDVALHSIITGRRQMSVSDFEIRRFRAVHGTRRVLAPLWDRLPDKVRSTIKRRVLTY